MKGALWKSQGAVSCACCAREELDVRARDRRDSLGRREEARSGVNCGSGVNDEEKQNGT